MSRSHVTLDIEAVTGFCEIAYGARWVSQFAADLSVEARRTVSPTQVHQWTSKARPVPAWVADVFVPVLRRRAYNLQRKANQVSKLAADIELAFAPRLSPNLEPDIEADGPSPQA